MGNTMGSQMEVRTAPRYAYSYAVFRATNGVPPLQVLYLSPNRNGQMGGDR